jgi:hypothetical protein
MALLRKHKSSTFHTSTELEPRKKLEEARDRKPTHENSVNKRSRERTYPSSEMDSNLFRIKEVTSSVNKQGIEVNGSTNNPINSGYEMVKTSTGTKDDIFGDLPLLELESSKIMFRTGVHELPTVIEESFITNQTEADSIPEAVPLRLIDASDITAHTPSPLEDLVKSEDIERACISHSDVEGSHPSTVGIDGVPNHKNINMVKPGLGDMQLKLAEVCALGSHSVLRSKYGSGNPLQGCFDVNKNCSQEIKKHGSNSTSSPPTMRTRTEETKYKDAKVKGKSTDITDTVAALPAPANHSYQASVLPSAVSRTVFSTSVDSNDVSSFRSRPAKECIPITRSGNFRTNMCNGSKKHVDPCAALSTDNQGTSHSKLDPIFSPANIGMAFMKLPGLQRMEILNYNAKIGENRFSNAESMNTVRYQKQQLLSGMTYVMQGQKQIGLGSSQVKRPALDDYGGQGDHHLQQPTVRLMGKTVSVCSHSKDHNVSTMDKVSPNNVAIEASRLSTISCQLPPKRSFPCQNSVTQRVHLNNSSDFLARIPNNSVPGQNTTVHGLHDQRAQPTNSSATVKGCTWNFGNQFVCQAELDKAAMVSANSQTRHLELHQPPHLISIPQNQQSHLWTPAAHTRKDQCFVGPAVNQSSPVPKSLLNASMKEKYQNSTLLSYNDPSSMPIRQPYQIPGAKSSSASVISFFEYGADNSLSRSSSPGLSLSLTTGLANESVSTSRAACAGSLTNADGRKAASFVEPIRSAYADNVSQPPAKPISNRTVYAADNVSQQPAKRQLVTGRKDFMSMGPNIVNHSPGWSLSDAVGPQVLDFSKRMGRDAAQMSKNESDNPRASSGSVPPIETWSRPGVVAGANTNTMLNPGQNLNDHSKLLYSTKFSVDSGINSVIL